MEADWAAEIGPNLPVVEADWPGFVDLRRKPDAVDRIPEAVRHAGLRTALLQLNAPESPLRTTKCDLWALTAAEIDPLEFGCVPDSVAIGMACYIDVVAIDATLFASFERHESWAKIATLEMRRAPMGPGRVDLVIRAARAADREGFAITLYAAGCGADSCSACASWSAALELAAAVTMRAATAARASSSIG